MEQDIRVDIKENFIKKLDDSLLSILLKDHSSGKNIVWATDNYEIKGDGYESYSSITVKAITGRRGNVIKPRVGKSKKEQLHRVRDKAEVFTPSWICNRQNNLIDNAWFEKENVFNIEKEKSWHTVTKKITFTNGKTWQDYVKANRMEISCGEAPYLCSRYDTVSGLWIELQDRIGVLDRKIRIINENTASKEEWLKWVKEAYKATYGFEWQGDSLLIARENLLLDNFPLDVKYRERKLKDMSLRLDGLYDIINKIEENIADATLRKAAMEEDAITLDNIYKLLLSFDEIYDKMTDNEKKDLISYLIKEVQIYPNDEPAVMPLKSITFNFPIYMDNKEVNQLLWDKRGNVETVVRLSKK